MAKSIVKKLVYRHVRRITGFIA